ncbi:MAG: FAD:protein FMN transferase [Vicingaceae bacterium]
MEKVFYVLSVVLLISCGETELKKQKIVVDGFAQGTTYNVTYVSNDGVNHQRAIDSMLIEIDNSLSTYQKKSLISKFNQSDSLGKTDELFKAVFDISKDVYQKTDGLFDPTIAPIVNAWGFGFENLHATDSTDIDSLLTYVDFTKISLNENQIIKNNKNMMLDFNAVAQGYSVDVLAQLLEQKGINNYLVEVGGELKAKGLNINDTLWRVGIDKPLPDLQEREIEAIVNLDNKALATSGNYRKFYEKNGMKFSHTINPKTGYPVEHNLLSATVITGNCGYADAYATAFMVMGLQDSKDFLSAHKELDALLIYSDEKGDLQTFVTEGLNKFIELNPNNN